MAVEFGGKYVRPKLTNSCFLSSCSCSSCYFASKKPDKRITFSDSSHHFHKCALTHTRTHTHTHTHLLNGLKKLSQLSQAVLGLSTYTRLSPWRKTER